MNNVSYILNSGFIVANNILMKGVYESFFIIKISLVLFVDIILTEIYIKFSTEYKWEYSFLFAYLQSLYSTSCENGCDSKLGIKILLHGL